MTLGVGMRKRERKREQWGGHKCFSTLVKMAVWFGCEVKVKRLFGSISGEIRWTVGRDKQFQLVFDLTAIEFRNFLFYFYFKGIIIIIIFILRVSALLFFFLTQYSNYFFIFEWILFSCCWILLQGLKLLHNLTF